MKTLKNKLKYPQPHSIKISGMNEALRDRTIEYLHHRSKYMANYYKSKQTRRLYD
jgi:hypothetical protein